MSWPLVQSVETKGAPSAITLGKERPSPEVARSARFTVNRARIFACVPIASL